MQFAYLFLILLRTPLQGGGRGVIGTFFSSNYFPPKKNKEKKKQPKEKEGTPIPLVAWVAAAIKLLFRVGKQQRLTWNS
jgi:hypothetical protein